MKNEYILLDENTLEMTVTQGQKTCVDVSDMALFDENRWNARKGKSNKFYVRSTMPTVNGKQKNILLHRVIMGITDPKIEVDHIDGDTLNNRRSNLRIATHSENQRNQVAYKTSKTGIKNIAWHKREKKYRVQIQTDGKQKTYGSFHTIEEAIKLRDELLPLLHGEFANTKDKKDN